ncbi:MAG: thiamine phosphate synthase [Gemmatimonadales bacterium]|nr:thiamine phosphate synthase [Gemmatimonadales bacterium]
MRPLPRLLAFCDSRIAAREDLGIRAGAIAAAGPVVGLVARLPGGSGDALTALAARFVALAAPPMASVLVSGRADVALAAGAHGVIAREADLPLAEMRQLTAPSGYFHLCSVHDVEAAQAAIDAGTDALVVGTIWPSASHPGRPGAGLGLIEAAARLGYPVFAIGGVTVERAQQAREAGAWGVAAIGAVWDAADSYRAAVELVNGER